MLTDEQSKAIAAMAAKFRRQSALAPDSASKKRAATPAKAKAKQPPRSEEPVIKELKQQHLPSVAALDPVRTRSEVEDDEVWAHENLRWHGDQAIHDIANVLRIFTRHPDFYNRFRFNRSMGKVLNRGKVMLGWQIDELCAVIQERFIPGISEPTVYKALMVCANQSLDKPYE